MTDPHTYPTGQAGGAHPASAPGQFTQHPAAPAAPGTAVGVPAGGAHAYAYERPDASYDQGNDNLGQPLGNIGQIVSDITQDLSTLVRQETELAKAEIKQSATRAGKGAGLFGGAGFMGWFAFLFLSIALWWGISRLIDSHGWGALIVGVLYAIIAGVLAMMGKSEMNKIKGLQRTAETASKIPDALKGNETTNG